MFAFTLDLGEKKTFPKIGSAVIFPKQIFWGLIRAGAFLSACAVLITTDVQKSITGRQQIWVRRS
jgi:hypothetical protein